MGIGYTRTDTANNIANGNVIDADDIDAELNAVESAFSSSTGHTHDGTSAEGAPIELLGPAQDIVATSSVLRPKVTNTIDLGTSSLKYKDAYLAGDLTVSAVTATGALSAGNTSITGTLSVTTNTTLTGDLTVNGSTTLGDTSADTVILNADVASSLIPSNDGVYDLGATGSEWNNLYVTGVANVDSLLADSATISGGTIDGVAIGATTRGVGNFTAMDATGNAAIDGNLEVGGTVDITSTLTANGNTVIGSDNADTVSVNAGVNTNVIPATTDIYDLGSTTKEWNDLYIGGTANLATVSISSGTIDNVTIGGTTPGLISGSTITATTAFSGDLSGNADTATSATTATSAGVLSNARDIILDGNVTGLASFDGSSDITITTIIADDSHAHIISNVDGLQIALDAKIDEVHTGNVDITGDVTIVGELKATSLNEEFSSITSSAGTATIDCETANVFSITLSEATTFSFTNPPSAGTAYGFTLKIIQDASASEFGVTFPASVKWANGLTPTISIGANQVDIVAFFSHDGGTTWYGFLAGKNFS